MKRHSKGFTLIELMVVVGIIGILAAIAYPSYTEYIRRGKRANAAADITQTSIWLERFYSQNFTYESAAGVNTQFTTRFTKSPIDSGDTNYTITLTNLAPRTFTVVLTRSGSMVNDACGNFNLDHLGQRTLTSYDTTQYATLAQALQRCWR
jgi:type IV pilus assembly protein PilE